MVDRSMRWHEAQMRKRGAMLGGGARWGTEQCRGEERSWTSTVGSGVVVTGVGEGDRVSTTKTLGSARSMGKI